MTAKEILTWFDLKQGTATKKEIRRAWYASPEQGVLDPVDVQNILGRHYFQTMDLYSVLLALGCVPT